MRDRLELELRDRPGQLHFLIEYGRHLLWLNDPKGHAVLAEACKSLEEAQRTVERLYARWQELEGKRGG